MRFSLTKALPAAVAAALVLPACGTTDDTTPNDATAGDGPTVIASFYPLAFVTQRVAGESATVENLTQPGVESHHLELTGQQVGRISEADLVVYLGGYQPSVDQAVEQNTHDSSLDIAALIELADHHDHDDHDHDDHDHDDHDHDDHHDDNHDDHHGHDHGDLDGDPHVWLDPAIMETIVEAVADQLATIDPDNAERYHDNGDALIAELHTLDEEYTTGLAQCERTVIVVAHEAFGYLANRYGLEQVGISGLDPDAEPSPERLARVHDVVADEGITTVFYERLVSPAVAERLADDLGIEAAVLDPIEGLTDDTADEDYLSLMRANLDSLRTANGCV